jgi:hypothetical protein
MKFYELPQATQDMLVERQRDYVTSCMDWLEDLFPLINDRVNEEYGRIFTEPFDALMNIQEFEWPHNIVWSTTYTELDLEVFSEALGVFVPSYNARLELSPNGRVRLFFGEYQADSSWREFEDACTKILAEVKDVILDIVSEYYEEATSTAYIESQLWDEDFKPKMNRYAYVGRPCQLEQEIESLQTQGYCLFSRFTGSEGGHKVKQEIARVQQAFPDRQYVVLKGGKTHKDTYKQAILFK